ncbi:NAD(P)/FAD-dependent oxidoreductase [Sphingopyxis sp. RIFCSPHIGHO2_12_FULL_65_19]|uniref:NAD(P)/FAD-dependent oxidoreductase n=1 Tax=Sphingopyxis sp. RIFCSPHIGHO2_12_FULL_65_19 TaxID=1802172 RepID=UPI0008ADBD89|nr:FAD-binding oxidoreductase [Sphingopyxis sp. RIFCSPHIGHO2_12_FULL_65_19]OHD08871.1 MAG: FAD-dependent oxidoreductase [Sphingopyxis sp. RIFCSPHIGHO2_12_FULL_65_19]
MSPASATHHRDLRTGQSIWSARRRPSIEEKPLTRDVACDIVVVGAGISGALIAEQLSDAGFDVVIVDRRGPVEGSTAASTAMLQYEIDTPLHQMAERIGRDKAERIWRRSRQSVDALRERTERLGLDVDGATRGSIYLDGNLLDAAGLAREAEARRRAGFEIELLKPAQVEDRYGIKGRHAIIGYGNYSADPRRLAAGYLNVAISRGARLYSPVDICDIMATHAGVTLVSARGPTIRARHVVMATGYEMMKGIPRKGNKIISSWSIATRPQPRAIWPTAAMIWEAADPYLYIRTTPAGEIICGGEDEEIADAGERDAKLAAKTEILSRKLAALLPHIDATPSKAWAGSFGDSPVGTPTIGRIPRMPNCYAAMGYGGNGITFSMMAAQILRGLICGYGDADADLVSFHRTF